MAYNYDNIAIESDMYPILYNNYTPKINKPVDEEEVNKRMKKLEADIAKADKVRHIEDYLEYFTPKQPEVSGFANFADSNNLIIFFLILVFVIVVIILQQSHINTITNILKSIKGIA